MPSDIVLSDEEVTIKGKLKTTGIEDDREISTRVIRGVHRISCGGEWGIYLNDESRDILFAASFIRLQDADNPNPKDQSSVALSRYNDWLILNQGDGFKNGVMIDGKNGLKVDSINISKPHSSFYSKNSALVATDKNELVLNQGDSFANGVVIEGKNGLKLKGSEGYDINNNLFQNVTSISADKIVWKKYEYKHLKSKYFGYSSWAWVNTTTIDLLAKIGDLSKENRGSQK